MEIRVRAGLRFGFLLVACAAFAVPLRAACLSLEPQIVDPNPSAAMRPHGASGANGSPAPQIYGGVNFGAADRLEMPQYHLCHNLVQNPSFEEGFKYWQYASIGTRTANRIPQHYRVLPRGGPHGGGCLEILGESHQWPAHLDTFAIPVHAGTLYTISFYARANIGTELTMRCTTAVWPTFIYHGFWLATKQWKRYSFGFKAPNGLIDLDFGVESPGTDRDVWLADVQLERGPLTAFVRNPAGVRLATARRGNLMPAGIATDARLVVHGPPGAKGWIHLNMTQFLGSFSRRENLGFTIGADGTTALPLPWAQRLGSGLYVFRMDLKLDSGFARRQFDRLGVMHFLDNRQPLKNLCALGGIDARFDHWARMIAFWKHVGIGAAVIFDPPPHPFLRLMAKNRVLDLTSIFRSGAWSGKWNLQSKVFHLDRVDLRIVEQRAFQKARRYPEIHYWKLVNEPSLAYDNNLAVMKRFIQILAAARRGILRANPRAVIVSPDPYNMAPTGGIRYLDTFLKAGGASVCNIIGVHPYRIRPETPDMDADTATLLHMLDRRRFTGPVWFDEGMDLPIYQLPVYDGMTVLREVSSDKYRCGTLSYDLGYGEGMNAAYAARCWLVGFKYSRRVGMQVDWIFFQNAQLDVDMTPAAPAFVPNTLERLLGNARFRCDVDLGQDVRCYVFEDSRKRPVAVLWSYSLAVDKGITSGPVMDIRGIPHGVDFHSLMGNRLNRPSNGRLRLTSYPVFLRGRPGSYAAFTQALRQAVLHGASPIGATLRVVAPGRAQLLLRNMVSRGLKGTLKISPEGNRTLFDKPVAMAPKRTLALSIRLPGRQTDGLRNFAFRIAFQPGGEKHPIILDRELEVLVCPWTPHPIPTNGRLSNWPARSAIPLPERFVNFPPVNGAAESSLFRQATWKGPAILYTAWNKRFLYLAVKVCDDTFHPAAKPNAAWTGTSLQLYFDRPITTGQRPGARLNGGYQSYELWPARKGAVVWRDAAADQRNTGPVPQMRCAFRRIADGYIYELAIPAGQLAPLTLKPDSRFRFALLVNHNNGTYRDRGLTLTPAGTEPYMHPKLYPTMILVGAGRS